MIEIKQSTAFTFMLGPFVDVGDGVTAETGLATAMDNATTGIRVSKNGGDMADRNDSTVPTHDEDGFYNIVLDATDTNALGHLHVEYSEVATCLPAWKDFNVLTANAWDSKYGADKLQVDVRAFVGETVPAPAVTGVPDVNMTHHVDVAASVTNSELDVNMNQISGDSGAADKLEESATAIVLGVSEAGTLSVTAMTTDLTEPTDDHYIGRTVIWTTGVLAGQASDITDYLGSTGMLTYSTLTEPPGVGDAFVIV